MKEIAVIKMRIVKNKRGKIIRHGRRGRTKRGSLLHLPIRVREYENRVGICLIELKFLEIFNDWSFWPIRFWCWHRERPLTKDYTYLKKGPCGLEKE